LKTVKQGLESLRDNTINEGYKKNYNKSINEINKVLNNFAEPKTEPERNLWNEFKDQLGDS